MRPSGEANRISSYNFDSPLNFSSASPLFTAESLNSIYLNKNLAGGHPKDINKAKDYLKKSGFYWKNGDLYDKLNNKVEFDLYTNAGNTEREAIGVMVKQDLEDLGIT
jgi:peptide/nickel transport system substrate-binding protein